MNMKIWFDMDGTIADLYGVTNWLDYLIAGDAFPYANAKPLLNMNLLARYLNKLLAQGHEVGVISWLAKNSNAEYDEKVKAAKLAWLNKHLKSVNFTTIHIVAYGTNKLNTCGEGILFDDEDRNRRDWGEGAHEPAEILNILKGLVD